MLSKTAVSKILSGSFDQLNYVINEDGPFVSGRLIWRVTFLYWKTSLFRNENIPSDLLDLI